MTIIPTSSSFLLSLGYFSLLTDTTFIHSLTLNSDISALKSFKSSINPSSISTFSCLSSWDFSTDPCSLPRRTHFICGLTCDSSPSYVTAITLREGGYQGTLSPEISKLTQLILLDLSDNHFYGPIPSSLFSLPNLKTLTLRLNSFSGSLPPSIPNLKSLESLDISSNSLSGSLPNQFNAMIQLKILDLSFNKFNGSIPIKLSPNLVQLLLKGNSLSGSLQERTFTELKYLAVIELGGNSLYGSVQPWLFLLPSLQQMDLSSNRFTSVEILKPFKGKDTNLVAVNIGFNRIKGVLSSSFNLYPSLSSLDLRFNQMCGEIPAEYGKNGGKLKRLFLEENFLTGVPPAGLISSGSLFSGNLSGNCLKWCPASSPICKTSQKKASVCRRHRCGRPKS